MRLAFASVFALAILLSGCCSFIFDYFDRPGFSSYAGFEDFSMGLRLAANGDAICTVQNTAPATISMRDFNIFAKDGAILCGSPISYVLQPGDDFVMELRDCGSWINGSRVEVKIELNYNKEENGVMEHKIITGTAKVTVREEYIWKE